MAATGLVIGKFLPFHHGHEHLLKAADAAVDRLTVIVCAAAWHDIPVALRVAWIAESFPEARLVVIDQEELGLGEDGAEDWARATIDALGEAPDVVFTSEDYGPAYARAMGAAHVTVDRERVAVPVSGTAVRARPLAHLDLLPRQVRAHYVRRVCVIGAESTGKTALAADLAAHYGVPFVPEFGRYYCEAMPAPTRYRWSSDDFRTIARTQARFEDDAARWVGPLLVCDTNPFVTSVFHQAYLGRPDQVLEDEAAARRYDLFLLCGDEIPLVQDRTGLRRDRATRAQMHQRYRRHLEENSFRFTRIEGTRAERLAAAVAAVDALLSEEPGAAPRRAAGRSAG